MHSDITIRIKKKWIKAGLREDREEDSEAGIKLTIKSCQDLGGIKEQIKDLLIKNHYLSEEDASIYIEKYW